MSRRPDPRTEEAITLRLRAIGTDQENITDLDHWLLLGGYTQQDIEDSGVERWKLLRNNFSKQYGKRRAAYEIPDDKLPLWEKPVTSSFLRFEDVPEEVKAHYTAIIAHAANSKAYKQLINVNLQQLDITDLANAVQKGKRSTATNSTIMQAFIRFFTKLGMHKVGVTYHNLICSVMMNNNDNFDFQEAHQDYYPKAISTGDDDYETQHLAWSAIFPMTDEGSWITIWFSRDVSRSYHIKLGQVVLFRSDVVHCGGRPRVDLKKGVTFYRLHFYLQTSFQLAPKNEINKFYLDGKTPLASMYKMTPEQQEKFDDEKNKKKKNSC